MLYLIKYNIMIKYSKIFILFLGFLSTFGAFFVPFSTSISWQQVAQTVQAEDILENVFKPSKDNWKVLNPGNTPASVGNRIFKWSIAVVDSWGNITDWLETKPPLVVRITMIILEVTMVLWVTMCIIIGIMYALAAWDEAKQKKLIGYLWNILIGILVALAADVIIVLVRSFSQSTII